MGVEDGGGAVVASEAVEVGIGGVEDGLLEADELVARDAAMLELPVSEFVVVRASTDEVGEALEVSTGLTVVVKMLAGRDVDVDELSDSAGVMLK